MYHCPFVFEIDVFCKIPRGRSFRKKAKEKSREQQVPMDDSGGAMADL